MQTNKKQSKTQSKSRFPEVQAEGIITGVKPQHRPHGFFTALSNDALVEYARKFCEERSITSRKSFCKTDASLYQNLINRKLISKVIPESRSKRPKITWPKGKDGILQLARDFCEQNGIKYRKELMVRNARLYSALRRRGLVSEVLPELKNAEPQNWKDKGNKELIEFAKEFCKQHSILSRGELSRRNPCLYHAVLTRGLICKVIRKSYHKHKRSKWELLTDTELVEMCRDSCLINGIQSRTDLLKHHFMLYMQVLKRGLMNEIMPKHKTGPKPE